MAGLACTTYVSGIDNTPGVPVREIPVSRPGTVTGTGPESQDVVAIADQMMRSLLGVDAVSRAANPPTVAVLPMRNNTRFAINSDIFVKKLRAELNTKAAGRMIFLARDRINAVMSERNLKRGQGFTSDPSKVQSGAAGADYFLTGEMNGMAKSSRQGQEDYILYQFQLIDAESSAIVWEDQYEIKRMGQDDAVYR